MYHFVLLLAIQGAGQTPAQPAPARLAPEGFPVQLGVPIPDPNPLPRPALQPIRTPRTAGPRYGTPTGVADVVGMGAGPQDVVLTWNETTLLAIKSAGTPPPQAARNLAMVHAAVYDAINSIVRAYRPFLVQDAGPEPAALEAAAAVAAHRVLMSLYPGQLPFFNSVLNRSLASVPAGPAKAAGVALGQRVAEQVLAWRSNDGADRQVAYFPGRGIGQWQQTPPDYQAPLLPQWPRVTCFCLRNARQFRPAAPPALNSAEYASSLNQVKALGGFHSTARTAEQTEIAWFWLDGQGTVTPPGHWNRIAQTVARSQGNTPVENARLFALLNLALADAGISCWDCKYHFSLWRPIHAIWYADRDGNPDTVADLSWTPLLPTPPFPSYTSGHSTFSSAAATMLACFFGTDEVPFAIGSEDRPGVTRSFASFSAAAREAGMSRIYGGIHYDFDNEAGLASGRTLAEYICGNYLRPVQDGARPIMSKHSRDAHLPALTSPASKSRAILRHIPGSK